MFRHDCDVDITVSWEGSIEFDLTLVGILEITQHKEKHKFYFKRESSGHNIDEAEALVVTDILKWLDDNSTIKLPSKFVIKIIDIPDSDEEHNEADDEEESEPPFHTYTLESMLQIAEQYKELERKPTLANFGNERFSEAYWDAYVKLKGNLTREKYVECLWFFLSIMPLSFSGEGAQIGLTREKALQVWNFYMQTHGLPDKAVSDEAVKIFKSVDSVHPLS